MGMNRMTLDAQQVVFLCVDMQTRFMAELPDALGKSALQNMSFLTRIAQMLRIPLFVTEQNPTRLGTTVPLLQASFPAEAKTFEKMEFSAMANPAIREALLQTGREQVVVFGMEAHVCVFQTVRDLLAMEKTVHVPQDAVLSRTLDFIPAGMQLVDRAGGIVTTTETVLFDLLKKAGTSDFRTVLSWIKVAQTPIGFSR